MTFLLQNNHIMIENIVNQDQDQNLSKKYLQRKLKQVKYIKELLQELIKLVALFKCKMLKGKNKDQFM